MNLLTEPLFPVLIEVAERKALDLPTLLAGYADDRVLDLPFLRPHQRAPWHSFCVQLAALALHRARHDEVVADAATWRALLRRLTADWPEDEPWRLIVDDVTKPAFMQPPMPGGSGDPHRTPIRTADDLDVLVTAKDHGVKQGIGTAASPAAWIVALVLLQTTGVYYGSGNYGVCRMRPISQHQTGSGRPWVGLLPPGGSGAHWRRDVTVLLRRREWFFERVEAFAEADGAALLWCLPWDGDRSLGLDQLDPWFIEICRRVRLYRDPAGTMTAKSIGSSAARVAAKDYKGNVGDPWIPINLDRGSAAYNTAPRYAVMSEVLFERNRWLRPLLLEWHRDVDASTMTARFDLIVRGQGTTEGHYLREVSIEGERRLALFQSDEGRDRLAELGREMIEQATALRNKVLKIPLLTLIQAGEAAVDFRDKMASAWAQPWVDQVDQAIEPVFFDHLFARAEQGRAADQAWVLFLKAAADRIFQRAAAAVPIAGARRLKAIAVAEEKLGGLFFASFKGYLVQPEEEAADVG
jgi:CRISPR system Cascade subunit CasA